jgi:hypothetical protein
MGAEINGQLRTKTGQVTIESGKRAIRTCTLAYVLRIKGEIGTKLRPVRVHFHTCFGVGEGIWKQIPIHVRQMAVVSMEHRFLEVISALFQVCDPISTARPSLGSTAIRATTGNQNGDSPRTVSQVCDLWRIRIDTQKREAVSNFYLGPHRCTPRI